MGQLYHIFCHIIALEINLLDVTANDLNKLWRNVFKFNMFFHEYGKMTHLEDFKFSQPVFTCSKLKMETSEDPWHVQSGNKNIRRTSVFSQNS